MPYVARDSSGQVVALAESPQAGMAEELPADHPDLADFVARTCAQAPFLVSDLAFIRVMEDLVEILIRKGIIALSDLPSPAQDKLMERRALRGWLAGIAGIVDDGEGKVI